MGIGCATRKCQLSSAVEAGQQPGGGMIKREISGGARREKRDSA